MKSLIAFLILSFSIHSFAGGSDSGGGNVCYPAGKAPIALDLVTDGAEAGIQASDFSSTLNLNLPETDFLKKFHFYSVPYQLIYFENPNFQKFIRDLLKISAKSAYAAQIVTVGLAKLNFLIMDDEFKIARHAYYGEQTECTPSNTRAVIVYDNGMMYLSRKLWNQLPYSTQATILIHEILRNVQSVSTSGLSDQDLQNLTAHLMANFLGRGQSMDQHPFLVDYSPYWKGIFPNLKSGVEKIVPHPELVCQGNREIAIRLKAETGFDLFCQGLVREKIFYFDFATMAGGLKGMYEELIRLNGKNQLRADEKHFLQILSEVQSDFDLQTLIKKTDQSVFIESLTDGGMTRMLKIVQDYTPIEKNQSVPKYVMKYTIETDEKFKETAAKDFAEFRTKLKQKIKDY